MDEEARAQTEQEARRQEKERKKAEKQEAKKRKKAEREERQRRLLFPADKKGRHVMRLMNVLRVILYPIHWLVYPFRLHGHKKVGPGACIYVSNHYCIFDVFYPAHTTWEGIHFMAKEPILHAPVLGYVARRLGVIGALRDGSDVRTIMDSMKVLKNGEKLSLFPEGTRNKRSDEEFLPFHGGAAMLAIKTKTPVVPIVICNRPKVFHMTHVVIGEPMELTEYYGRKLTSEEYAQADEKLAATLYALRSRFREERAAKKRKRTGK